MTSPLYLSRAALRRDVPSSALRALLVPDDESARIAAGHRLVWTLFGDRADRTRDYLWREADAGVYYLLSRRPPEDPHGLFVLDPPKEFAPALNVGDRLAFSLRANATVARRQPGRMRNGRPASVPCDVVMDALYGVPSGERAAARYDAVDRAGQAWLERQGQRCGFILSTPASDVDDRGDNDADDSEVTTRALRVTGYRTLRVAHAGPAARIGILDFDGKLEVRDPAVFTAALAQGFGRAKAFGCGLMLLRRA